MTLPTVDEVLQAIQNCVRDDLWPETNSDWADRQARTALWALEHVRVRLARGRELMTAERTQLLELIAILEVLRKQGPELSSVVARIQCPEPLGRGPVPGPIEDLAAEVLNMRRVAEQVAEVSSELTAPMQQPLLRALMSYIHDQDRRLEAVVTLDYTC